MRKVIYSCALIATMGCSKKDDDKSSGTIEKSAANAPVTITQPVGVLYIALTAFGSIGSKIATVGTGLHLNGESFSESDCSENARPVARASDPADDKAFGNELRISNPRAPLQHFYCMMQKDTGSPDSFLGAISSSKDVLCILGKDLVFDGVERDITRTKADLLECFKEYTAEEQAEMIGEIGESVSAKLTANRPAAFGDAAYWDGSVSFKVLGETMRLLLKDSDNIVAIALNNGSGKPEAIDGFVAAVNKTTGEVNFEAKFQRIRTANGEGNSGWTRHSRAYVKGTMDADLKFAGVSEISGIFSNLYQKQNANAGDPIESGNLWSVTGGDSQGIKAASYTLACTFDESTQKQTCPADVNVLAKWSATAGSGSCNGSMSDSACGTLAALEMKSDSDTQFFMDTGHAEFQKTEDWFSSLGAPNFGTMNYKISQ